MTDEEGFAPAIASIWKHLSGLNPELAGRPCSAHWGDVSRLRLTKYVRTQLAEVLYKIKDRGCQVFCVNGC